MTKKKLWKLGAFPWHSAFTRNKKTNKQKKKKNTKKISKNPIEWNRFIKHHRLFYSLEELKVLAAGNTHRGPDTHKHRSAASGESSCSHPLQQRHQAGYSSNYTPSTNYPIIKPLAVSHHINWVPPSWQFVQSQSATGLFKKFFIFFSPAFFSQYNLTVASTVSAVL